MDVKLDPNIFRFTDINERFRHIPRAIKQKTATEQILSYLRKKDSVLQ